MNTPISKKGGLLCRTIKKRTCVNIVDLLIVACTMLFSAGCCVGLVRGKHAIRYTGRQRRIIAKKVTFSADAGGRLLALILHLETNLDVGVSIGGNGFVIAKTMGIPSAMKDASSPLLCASLGRGGGYEPVDPVDPVDPPLLPPFFFDSEREGPFVAVITETDTCHSKERVHETLAALRSAVTSGCVDLISIRATPPNNGQYDRLQFHEKLVQLIHAIKSLREDFKADFVIVVNDNVDAAIEAGADGVHVKERDISSIPTIRDRIQGDINPHCRLVVGTSCHSAESALSAHKYRPDYLFVGTCYMTQSHPEKTSADMLEGPALPGKVRRILIEDTLSQSLLKEGGAGKGDEVALHVPVIFAIGGINESNCAEPVMKGANGVAVIRSILCASDPGKVAKAMKENMSRCT